MDRGNPEAVRVGPGKLLIAPVGSTEPTDLETPWAVAWTPLGYTNEGSEFVFNNTFENIGVAEELEPIDIEQTTREILANFALAEVTAANMQRAFNGGTISTPSGLVTFEPPAAGVKTYTMLGWESEDADERWIFRKCLQVGSVNLARRRAPDKALLPMSFRAVKPAGAQAFKAIFANLGDHS
jgi:hypothetical protein